MWLPLTLLVFAGLVSADYEHGWKVGNEYTYLVRSRTLTSLDQLSNQYTGILMKALLTVQVKDTNTLTAKVWKGQYARIHKDLPDSWESDISDQMLELRDLAMSQKPFEIKLKHGVIVDMVVDKETPTWEVNLLKSIVSQLQVDTQGENIIKSQSVQIPNDDEPYGSFKAMEDTVGGRCEVLYDITPLADYVLHLKPELVPMPQLKGDGQHIDIMKTKNLDKCEQRMNYHFGITGETNWEPGSNKNGKFLSQSSSSRIVISGNLKRFTIQSAVTTSKMSISPRFNDQQTGSVFSRMNLTLGSVNKVSNILSSPSNPESTGNLVYIYNNPFSDMEERRPNQGIGSRNSKQVLTSDSVSSLSSSEEASKTNINLLRGDSSSSSSSSSSISSSEEHRFWQPKPTLEDAPHYPLLPNFIGYKGKFIGKSGEIDVVKAAKELIFQIAHELEDPSNIPAQESLEKFTILCSLVRTMNRRQIAEVENNIHVSPNELKSNDKSQAVKQNGWAVFRDAITQAGTGPALLTIKNWIQKRDIESMEAVDILSRLPNNARTPTAEYIKAFFELATEPKVMNQLFLNSTALIAFTELVHQSQVNGRSIHNHYPVHTFGRLTSKHDRTVVQEYIPYLAQELKKAVKEGDSSRIQTFIVALGNIGHPKILSVFEPYLEGREQVTVFQRALMVSALGKLATHMPKLARSVLYKIYLNTMESHEVRCMAVYLITKTNPPLSMLQRMAEFTNYDTNKHVNSAVKSTIESLATLTDPEWREMAKKAQSVKNLLNKQDYSYQYSHGFISDSIMTDGNLATKTMLNYIGSDDSFIPRALYLAWFTTYGDFKTPPTELIAMISSVRPLMDMVHKVTSKEQPFEKMATEKIAEELKIKGEDPIELEGNIMWKTKFLSRFLPFDKNFARRIPNLISKHALAMKEGGYVNLNKLMSYDVVLSFPTETGLPFVYTLRVPTLCKFSGNRKLQIGRDFGVNAKSDARIVYSRKVQGRIGFVTPFEHQHYIAGVDTNSQVYAPVKLSLDVNVQKKNMHLNIWPLQGEEKARLLHYSTIPYTSNHNILSLRPLLVERNTQIIHVDEPLSITLPQQQNRGIRLDIEADKSNNEFWNIRSIDNLQTLFTNDDSYRKSDLFMNLEHEQHDPVTFTVSYDSMDVVPDSDNSQQWTPVARAVEPSNKEANSGDRKKQFLREAGKGIKLAKSQIVDVQLQIPGELKNRNVVTFAWSNSEVENKERTLLYWHFDMPSQEIKQEVCAASQMVFTPDTRLFFDEAILSKPMSEFDIDIRYGKSCSDSEQINIRGKGTQSTEMKEHIRNSATVRECEKQIKQGNKLLRVCQNAAALAMTLDEIDVSFDVRSKVLQNLLNKGINMIGSTDYVDTDVDTSNPKNAGKSKIDVKAKVSKNLKFVDLSLHTPTMDIKFNDVDLDPLDDTTSDSLLVTDDKLDVKNVDYSKNLASCVLDNTRAETFDGKEYPLRLGSCWRVLMTTYPKLNPEKPSETLQIPQEYSVSILGRDAQNGQKEVKIIFGQHEIVLVPTSQRPQVTVNGQKVQVSHDVSYQQRQGDDIMFEVFEIGDRSIGVTSDKFDLNLVFDGTSIMIEASDKFRGLVRGLCGNYDGESFNDFLSPANCMLKKPDQFIAAYTLTKDQCEGDDLQMAKSLQKSDCVPEISTRQSNVINDIESGKASKETQNWGYHQDKQTGDKRCTSYRTKVIEKDNQLCFTTRPVISCLPTCSATETKSKSYQFYCAERNEASLNLKKRIEKGANPDLSQKPVSMSQTIQVPLACRA